MLDLPPSAAVGRPFALPPGWNLRSDLRTPSPPALVSERNKLNNPVLEYIVSVVRATRESPSLALGVSPRGATALLAAREAGIPLQVNAHGSLLTPFFTEAPVRDYESALTADTARYGTFHRAMLTRGIYLPPSQFEAWFLSAAHTDEEVRRCADAFVRAPGTSCSRPEAAPLWRRSTDSPPRTTTRSRRSWKGASRALPSWSRQP